MGLAQQWDASTSGPAAVQLHQLWLPVLVYGANPRDPSPPSSTHGDDGDE